MEEYKDLIAELADLAGIIPEYYDIFGKKHVTSHESRVAVLSAMDFATETVEEVRREIVRIRVRQWTGVLDPVTVISQYSQPYRLPLHLPLPSAKEHALTITVTIEDEEAKKQTLYFPVGSVQADQEKTIDGRRFVRILLHLPELKIGYYTISLLFSHPDGVFENDRTLLKSTRFIVTPDSCYLPEQLKTGKTWGLALNLYAIRSERNWGVGDLGDLERVVSWLSGLNAGAVGINPLHAIPNTVPYGVSPYSPVSRLYRNFIYIDMENVPEVLQILDKNGFADRIASLQKSERIDYEAVAALKHELLERAFAVFFRDHYEKDSERAKAFRAYLQREGRPLENYALFLAISGYMKERHNYATWKEWPEDFCTAQSAGVANFRKEHEKKVLFFQYVQWLIDTQLSRAASSGNLAIGLYGDLAVGAVDTGSDGWVYQDVLAESVTVGAPPDDFNANGQDWGFTPMDPEKLRESGYDLFIYTIRKNMQYMGALRIDHALGLFRMFWVPKGMQPHDGAYVRCKAHDLIRIIALESVRNKTMVIGEDLGTITDEARNTLQRFSILSYRLFYFERNYPDPSFLAPDRYPLMSLSAVTTHDLPTLYGFWTGRDLDTKKQLGIIREESHYTQLRSDRERDRSLMIRALAAHGALPTPMPDAPIPAMTHELCLAVYRYLAVSPSKFVLVSLDDVIAVPEQQNMPGTIDEHPNWKQKTPLPLEEIITDGRFPDIASMFEQNGRSDHTPGKDVQ